MSKENFNKALQFLFPSEGGYVDDKDDLGGPTNMGITQDTYNYYRKNQGLPRKDVQYITKGEAVDLYYKYYWKPSGADDVSDPNMAVTLFDTAVLHGVGQAQQYYKQSAGDLDKFLEIRQKHYDRRVLEDPSQKKFYQGWNNRINNIKNNIKNGTFTKDNKVPNTDLEHSNNMNLIDNNYSMLFKLGIEYNDFPRNNLPDLNDLMVNPLEKQQTSNVILQELDVDKVENQSSHSESGLSGYANPLTGNNRIFTREDIGSMTPEDYAKHEIEIQAQMNTIGVPTNGDMKRESMAGGGVVYVNSYKRSDGTEVKGYYRSKPRF